MSKPWRKKSSEHCHLPNDNSQDQNKARQGINRLVSFGDEMEFIQKTSSVGGDKF